MATFSASDRSRRTRLAAACGLIIVVAIVILPL